MWLFCGLKMVSPAIKDLGWRDSFSVFIAEYRFLFIMLRMRWCVVDGAHSLCM
jgi:hypothetical protein